MSDVFVRCYAPSQIMAGDTRVVAYNDRVKVWAHKWRHGEPGFRRYDLVFDATENVAGGPSKDISLVSRGSLKSVLAQLEKRGYGRRK